LGLRRVPKGDCDDHARKYALACRSIRWRGRRAVGADLLFIRAGGPPLFLELKTSRGTQSESQRAFEAQAITAGAWYAIARSLDEALALLWQRGYLARKLV
jgi:hypothetical protein